jgi:hypothetical protein
MVQPLHQQLGAVAARSAALFQGFFRRPNPRLHAHHIRYTLLHRLIDGDQKIIGALGTCRNFGQQRFQPRAGWLAAAARP